MVKLSVYLKFPLLHVRGLLVNRPRIAILRPVCTSSVFSTTDIYRTQNAVPDTYSGSKHPMGWSKMARSIFGQEPRSAYINATSTRECMFRAKFAAQRRRKSPAASMENAQYQKLVL